MLAAGRSVYAAWETMPSVHWKAGLPAFPRVRQGRAQGQATAAAAPTPASTGATSVVRHDDEGDRERGQHDDAKLEVRPDRLPSRPRDDQTNQARHARRDARHRGGKEGRRVRLSLIVRAHCQEPFATHDAPLKK
jgi:hypothetical protein